MWLLSTALVWLVAAAHFAFLIYLPVGGFLALRWRRTIWLHSAAVAWAAGSVLLRVSCPLTGIERLAREHAGMAALGPAGFIDHYISDAGAHVRAGGGARRGGGVVDRLCDGRTSTSITAQCRPAHPRGPANLVKATRRGACILGE
jgi:hypothetical protein